MERDHVLAALEHAVSPEQERAALEHLRRWVEANPDDARAAELLRALEGGDWSGVRPRRSA